MDERFTYLVEKYLENELSKQERVEYEKYLRDPACLKYLEDAEKIEKIMKEELKNIDWSEVGLGTGWTAEREGVRIDKKSASKKISECGRWIADFIKSNTKLNPKSSIYLQSEIRNPKSEIDEDDIPEEIKQDVIKYGAIDDPLAREAVKRMHAHMIRHRRTTFLFKYALPLAGMIASSVYIWSNFIKPLPGTLYMVHFKPYEFAVISPAPVPDEKISLAMSMYKSGDYTGSAKLCNEIIASGTHESDIHFLYGMNLMSLDSTLQAIKEFDAYISGPPFIESNKQRPVYWYKSLCYLKLGKPVPAILSMMKPYYLKLKKKVEG